MAQPGSIGPNPISVIQQSQRATSAPLTGADHLRVVTPMNVIASPHIQSAPHQVMEVPSENSWSSWGQGVKELIYTSAAFVQNAFIAAPSATNLGMRCTNYLATPAGQATASIAMRLLENSKPMIDKLLELSQQDKGQAFLTGVQNFATSLPGMAETVCQMFNDHPELGQNMLLTFQNLSRTTQNVATHLNPTSDDLQNILNIMNTLMDGINQSHLTQAMPGPPDEDGDVFYDAHSAMSSIIDQMSHISTTQVTHLIDGTLQHAPTEVARFVTMISESEGNIEQLCGRFAAYVTNTSINNFSADERNTIALSVVNKFNAAMGDLPNDDKQRLMHALLKNDPFGSILTPLIRHVIGRPPAEPVVTATIADITDAPAAPAVPPPVTFAQKMRRFFAPLTHAIIHVGQNSWGVIQRFIALFTPLR
jgi:hypothetical protein